MRLSDLQSKKIINVKDGKNVGSIIDITISRDGEVESLIIESTKGIFNINKDMDTKVYWNDIEKIGEDVILIKKDY